MNIKIKLDKETVAETGTFCGIIGVAALFDNYFDKNPVHWDEIEAGTNDQHNEPNTVYLFSQLNMPGVKIEFQKPAVRNLQPKTHDRLIQKYHQIRNYQVLKAEVEPKTSPLISVYHYLAFKNYFFTDPDDDPPLLS